MNLVDAVDKTATKLRVRPLAARGYWFLRASQDRLQTLRYRAHTVRDETYRVTVGDATARFHVPTRQEFLDFHRLEERPVLAELLGELRPDDVFYDVGANIGLYACLVADRVDKPVVAFEPHPRNADRLAENARLNDTQIALHRIALAASDGTADLTLAPGFGPDRLGSAGHTLLTDYHRDTETSEIEVSKRRGDDLISATDLPQPTVLKIDVEGAEADVVAGLEETLSQPECRLVYCETHEERLEAQGHSASGLRDTFEEHGFSVDERTVREGQSFFRADKR
jgi:FkbM family methyltransferase